MWVHNLLPIVKWTCKVNKQAYQSVINESCEWKSYKLGWTHVNNIVFIQDYIQGYNWVYTISIDVWFALTSRIYVMPFFNGRPWDANPVWVVTNQLHKFKNMI
jgi:hypothetical protein